MKTYKFDQVPLSKEDRFFFNILSREYQIKKMAIDQYILDFILPRMSLDKNKGFVQYDVVKEEFTFTETPTPIPDENPEKL